MLNQEQLQRDALKFLRENITAVIATSFNDEPRASTVYYFADSEFNFYFTTKRNTSKYMNIEMNPKVALVVGTGPEHITIQAHGVGEIITDDESRDMIIEKLLEIKEREQVNIWPIDVLNNLKDRNKVVFKIKPEQVFYMNLDSKLHPDSITEDLVQVFP
jgi:general stress protein 26